LLKLLFCCFLLSGRSTVFKLSLPKRKRFELLLYFFSWIYRYRYKTRFKLEFLKALW
jgi:hypothetical protein